MSVPRKRIVRDPSEIVESIGQKAASVKDAVAALTGRIEQFQTYLGGVRGRVESYCYGAHPDADSEEDRNLMSLCLWLHKEGKEWVLSWANHDERHTHYDDYTMNFKPLVDAPLKIKLAAVKMFPDVLETIEKSQSELVRQVTKATEEYDAFAASLPSKEGK